MPLIETDTLVAFLNKKDSYHENAKEIIKRISKGELDVKASSVSLIELQLIYKSKQIEYEFETDLGELQSIKNLEWASIDVESCLSALYFRKTYNLSFFDSLHVGIAINLDKKIISQDQAYDNIAGLKKIPLTYYKTIKQKSTLLKNGTK